MLKRHRECKMVLDNKCLPAEPTKSKWIAEKRNKCQFCMAYFKDEFTFAAHNETCTSTSRLSAFMASDGRIKFTCAVCRDVFDNPTELSEHEQLHKYPGGFACAICEETFSNETDRVHHTENVHKAFKCLRCEDELLISTEALYIKHCDREHNGESGYAICLQCGASFEEKSHLRFHSETECGQFRCWTCIQCAAIFASENALSEHMEIHLPNGLKLELECDDVQPVAFTLVDCSSVKLPSVTVKEQSVDDFCSFSESTSLFDCNHSQYSDEDPTGIPNEVEADADDPILGDLPLEQPDELYRDCLNQNKNGYKFGVTAKQEEIEIDVECKWCGLKYISAQMKAHMEKEHFNGLYMMSNMQSKATRLKYIIPSAEVERNENGANENECNLCGRCFSAPQYLEKHKNYKHGKYECEKCGTRIMIKRRLFEHFRSDCGRRPFGTCFICMKSFDTKDEIIAHRTTHAQNEIICKICGKSYSTHGQLALHSVKHKEPDKPKEFVNILCKHCPKFFHSKQSWRAHMAGHITVRPFKCKNCDERFGKMTALQMHSQSCSGQYASRDKIDSKLVCEICDMHFAARVYLQKHILVHGPKGNLIIKCNCCKQYFATEDDLKKHKKEAHLKVLTCPHCKKVYTTRNNLKKHIKIVHKKQPRKKQRYTCEKCGLAFENIRFLEDHIKSDCGQNPIYKCDQCDKILSNVYTYGAHLKMHQDGGNKPFTCSHCDRAYRTKGALQTHTFRSHTGEKQLKCNYCEKRFFNSRCKMQHESTHTGIRPFMCQCGDRFSYISNLKQHRQARQTTCALYPLITKAFPKMITESVDSTKD